MQEVKPWMRDAARKIVMRLLGNDPKIPDVVLSEIETTAVIISEHASIFDVGATMQEISLLANQPVMIQFDGERFAATTMNVHEDYWGDTAELAMQALRKRQTIGGMK